MNDKEIKEVLTKYKTVAVVGISRDPSKDSHRVARYLKDHDFRIIPVNPTTNEVMGERSYKSLLETPPEIQKKIEIVDIFRPSAEVPSIVAQAVELKERYDMPHVIWMQLGIVDVQAAETARQAGLIVVMNRCMMQEHQRLFPNKEE